LPQLDVSGSFGAGSMSLHSVADLNVSGTLIANTTNALGFAGNINFKSDTGNVTIGDALLASERWQRRWTEDAGVMVDARVDGTRPHGIDAPPIPRRARDPHATAGIAPFWSYLRFSCILAGGDCPIVA
jgi:hypothetical protein